MLLKFVEPSLVLLVTPVGYWLSLSTNSKLLTTLHNMSLITLLEYIIKEILPTPSRTLFEECYTQVRMATYYKK